MLSIAEYVTNVKWDNCVPQLLSGLQMLLLPAAAQCHTEVFCLLTGEDPPYPNTVRLSDRRKMYYHRGR